VTSCGRIQGLNGDAQRIEQLGWMLFLKIFSDKDRELELMDDNYKSPIPEEFHWIKEKGNWAGDDEGITGDELLAFVDQKLFPAMRNIDLKCGQWQGIDCSRSICGQQQLHEKRNQHP
jgi:type I restriction enzyme M protein